MKPTDKLVSLHVKEND